MVEVFDKRFKNVADVEQALALPFLGFIPASCPAEASSPSADYLAATLVSGGGGLSHGAHLDSAGAASGAERARDQCRAARRQIHHRGESRGLVCATRAPCAARRCRLAASVAASALWGRQEPGLTDVLVHGLEWQQCRARDTDGQSQTPVRWCLSFESYGIVKYGTTETPYREWKTSFDLVIFDAPVVLSIPDVMILAPMMDGVLMVHSEGRSTRAMVVEAKRLLG